MHTEYAFAKLNLCLSVGARLDNGYHALESVMQSLSLCDTLYIEKDRALYVECPDVDMESNIVTRAARAFFAVAGIEGGANIRIEKRIPMEAGLGGGSSDAAAALRGLNRLYGAPLSTEALCDIGASLGADVPFCIRGGCAFAEGVGDVLTPIPHIDMHFVLIFNKAKLSTPVMYRLLDERGGEAAPAAKMRDALCDGDSSAAMGFVGNSFLPVAASLVPDVKTAVSVLQAHGGAACISGKGPTVFGFFTDEATARVAAKSVGGIYCKSVKAFE